MYGAAAGEEDEGEEELVAWTGPGVYIQSGYSSDTIACGFGSGFSVFFVFFFFLAFGNRGGWGGVVGFIGCFGNRNCSRIGVCAVMLGSGGMGAAGVS